MTERVRAPGIAAAALALFGGGAAPAAASVAECREPGAGAAAPLSSPTFIADPAHPARQRPVLFVTLGGPAAANARGGLERLGIGADGAPTGAVAQWPAAAASAPLFTDLARGSLRTAGNAVAESNATLSGARLGLGAGDRAGRERLIRAALEAARGAAPPPELDDPGEPSRNTLVLPEARAAGGAGPATVLSASADGLLRAIDADSGEPLWSFVPLERLGRAGSAAAARGGYRGSLSLYRMRAPPPGAAAAAPLPRAIVVFAGGAGSDAYFAFDLSDTRAPILLWRAGPTELPFAAVRRAPAAIARILIRDARQNREQAVVIAGGGDDGQAAKATRGGAPRGNRLFILDLTSGELLWHAAPLSAAAAEHADLGLARLDAPIIAGVRALDLDGDGLADRLYAADLGGRVWRFDVHNGETPARLVRGAVFASLGSADRRGPAAEARRFYRAPDAAYLRDANGDFVQVALGSGNGGGSVQDYFYALRDYALRPLDAGAAGEGGWNPDRVLGQATPFADPERDLAPAGRSPGWRLRLPRGESVTSEARTYAGIVMFATTGGGAPAAARCAQARPRRLYALEALGGGVPNGRAARALGLPASARALPVVFGFPAHVRGLPPARCGAGTVACEPPPLCFVGLADCGPLPPLAPLPGVWRELDPGP
jgi:hypothetical protein